MTRNVKTGVYVKNGESFNFNFYTTLRAYDKIQFVNSVTDTIIGDNYNSIVRDMVFDFMIVEIFTDVDVSNISKSDDVIDKVEDFLEATNIVEIVKANVDANLIEELNKAIDNNIEYRTGIHKNPITESLSHLLNTIDRKISDIDTDNLMKMAQVISNMSGELTPDKMLEAYSKSDMFKEKYRDLITDKKDAKATSTKRSRSNKKDANIKQEG